MYRSSQQKHAKLYTPFGQRCLNWDTQWRSRTLHSYGKGGCVSQDGVDICCEWMLSLPSAREQLATGNSQNLVFLSSVEAVEGQWWWWWACNLCHNIGEGSNYGCANSVNIWLGTEGDMGIATDFGWHIAQYARFIYIDVQREHSDAGSPCHKVCQQSPHIYRSTFHLSFFQLK